MKDRLINADQGNDIIERLRNIKAAIEEKTYLQDKVITPTDTEQTVTYDAPYLGLGNVTVSAEKLATKTLTDNGTYNASDDGKDGYSSVTVDMPLSEREIDDNGTYNAADDGLKGYSSVTVYLPLAEKTITENGTYEASSDDVKGYSKVVVDIEKGNESPLYIDRDDYISINYTMMSKDEDGYATIDYTELRREA